MREGHRSGPQRHQVQPVGQRIGRVQIQCARHHLVHAMVGDRVRRYLSPEHRDAPGSGCPVTALAVDAARAGCGVFEVFAQSIERIRNDPRHINVEVLHHGPLAGRRFQHFSLAFSTVEDVDALARMELLDGDAALAAFEAVRGELVL